MISNSGPLLTQSCFPQHAMETTATLQPKRNASFDSLTLIIYQSPCLSIEGLLR